MAKNTLREMRRELSDNLALEGVTPPASERLTTLLNRAKDHVVAQIELCNEHQLVVRKTFTVAAGDASIALPDGSGADPAVKRVLLINRTDLGDQRPGRVIQEWEREQYQDDDSACGPVMYAESNTLYFARTAGALTGMTLVLSYVGDVPDLVETDVSTSYARVPTEWADLIPTYATQMAIPASDQWARTKWTEIYKDRLNTLERSLPGRFHTGPFVVRPDDRDW